MKQFERKGWIKTKNGYRSCHIFLWEIGAVLGRKPFLFATAIYMVIAAIKNGWVMEKWFYKSYLPAIKIWIKSTKLG